jgi:hypothetical protein
MKTGTCGPRGNVTKRANHNCDMGPEQ